MDDVAMYTSEPISAEVHRALREQNARDRAFVEHECDHPSSYSTLFSFIQHCMDRAAIRWPWNVVMTERISRAAHRAYEIEQERARERKWESDFHSFHAA